MNRRKKALELFNTCGIKDTAINWHLWKRAFDLGYSFANEQKQQIVDIVEDIPRVDKCECGETKGLITICDMCCTKMVGEGN